MTPKDPSPRNSDPSPSVSPQPSAQGPSYDEALAVLTQMAERIYQGPSLKHLGKSVLKPQELGDSPSEQTQRAEARYRILVEQIPVVTFLASLDGAGSELYVSPQIQGLLGFSPKEWLSDPIRWFYQIHPDDRERLTAAFMRAVNGVQSFRTECRVFTHAGKTIWIHLEARMVMDEFNKPLFLQGVAFDLTENKEAEEKVRASLKEKDVLLREIHHRVKNNLQIMSSLLRLQYPKVRDPKDLEILRDSENRIQTMALVHEKLYLSPDLANIDFGQCIRDLVQNLAALYDLQARQINLQVNVEPVLLSVDISIPCALILNELVSNGMKHAFTHTQESKPTITIRFFAGHPTSSPDEAQPSECTLLVSDNGRGIPPEVNLMKSKTLGFKLVSSLTKQINGTLNLHRNPIGTTFEVKFPKHVTPSQETR